MTLRSWRAGASRVSYRCAAAGAGVLLLAGCQFGGLNSLNMPGTVGHGKGSYSVTVELPDVATLPQNSPVMVDDVTVGSVSGLDAVQRPDGSFYAAVKVSLSPEVQLPSNAIARVAQTSLLGSQHIDLAFPSEEKGVGELGQGSTIPLSRTGRYPTTEEVLSSLGVVVNNGNLGALQDITDEVYAAVADRAGTFAGLIPRLAELTGSLDHQTDKIIAAAEGLNRTAAIFARNTDNLTATLDALPGALQVLNDNRTTIVDAFAALGRLGTVASRVLSETKDDFAAVVKDLYPVIKALAENSKSLIEALPFMITFPFHEKYMRNAVRGDFLNVFVTFDLTLRRLGETVFTTGGFDPNMPHMHDVVNPPDWLAGATANLSGQAADPFEIPPGTAPGQEGAR
jgi:phospholipid/cholesterol/gamma-HCH transport system substrate-binding protein